MYISTHFVLQICMFINFFLNSKILFPAVLFVHPPYSYSILCPPSFLLYYYMFTLFLTVLYAPLFTYSSIMSTLFFLIPIEITLSQKNTKCNAS